MPLPKKPTTKKPLIAGAGQKKRAHRTPPKGYPKDPKKYAIPGEFKYPLDTGPRIQSAMSYWAKAANRKGYSAAEQASVAKRIVAAAKKAGKEVDPATTLGKLAGLKPRKKK